MDQISAPSFFHGHDGLWFYSSGTSDSIKKGNHHLPGMYRSRLMKKTEKRRHIIQLIATIVTNGYLVGFMQGKIQSGEQKFVCVPGLNCYSCPGAVGACPIGALQAVLGDRKFQFSYYVFGFLLFVSVLLGRVVCGFLCPFGFLQDLLYKIKSPKIKVPVKLDKGLRYLKYVMLAVPVILLPIFLILYVTSLWLIYFITGGLYLLPLSPQTPTHLFSVSMSLVVGFSLLLWKLDSTISDSI